MGVGRCPDAGFPLNFEIEGILTPFPYICTLNVN